MKTLNLTIKKKWFDMIASGEKMEEYREVKPYWIGRFINCHSYGLTEDPGVYAEFVESMTKGCLGYKDMDEMNKCFGASIVPFTRVKLTNGYSKTSPSIIVECLGIDIGPAVPEWSDNWPGNVFRIKLGKIVTP